MKLLFSVVFLSLLGGTPGWAMPAHILLIRHGEKPEDGNELNARGWERAKALPAMFERPEWSRLGRPAALFGMSPDKPGGSVRAIQTLKYLSVATHLPIQQQFHKDDAKELVKLLTHDRSLDGKFVVVCWEHKKLSDIADELGVHPVPDYPGSHFDRAWLVTMDGDEFAQFQDLPEHLLPGDDPK